MEIIQQLNPPVAQLHQVNVAIGDNLLKRLANTDRLQGDSGLKLRAGDAASSHGWKPFSGAVPLLRFNDKTYTKNKRTAGSAQKSAEALLR
jgi:hypothetical protein